MYARYGIQYPSKHLDQRQDFQAVPKVASGEVETVAHRSHDLWIFVRLASVLAVVCVSAVGVLQFVQ